MPKLPEKEKKYTESILQSAIQVFTGINRRINSLIECSVSDFDILNHNFKHYFSTIKGLTENINLLFESIIELPDEAINKSLDLLNSIQEKHKKAHTLIIRTDRHLVKFTSEISYSRLHLNNLKQNFSTLKLLFTNIRLEPHHHKLYNDLIEITDHLKVFAQKYDDELREYEAFVIMSTEKFEKLKNQQIPFFYASAERLFKVLSGIKKRKTECLYFNSSLHDLISQKSVSTSEILTNLQFQDIIRQKIEHVQLAQKELIRQLRKLCTNQKSLRENNPETLFEIILQIRNIGSLQAAQLMHANSEYQKAIENIVNKFGDLDEILTETLEILNRFLTNSESILEYDYIELDSCLPAFRKEFELLNMLNTAIQNESVNWFNMKKYTSISNSDHEAALDTLNLIITGFKSFKTKHSPGISITDTISQIISNYNKFRENFTNLTICLSKDLKSIEELLKPEMKEYFLLIDSIECDVKLFLDNTPGLFPMNPQKQAYSQIMLDEKEINSSRFDLGKVAYYKVFEKEVEIIITELNNLINHINLNELEEGVGLDKIEKLKKHYTMQSEREIHARFTGNRIVENENNNDIELF